MHIIPHQKKLSCFALIILSAMVFITKNSSAQYNQLWIPDTLSGTVFNLMLSDSTKQFLPGPSTATMAINGRWWGPTMIWNKDDTVHLNVMNHLMDTTTVHWHGIHLPAMMDGGPHQPVPPMTTWSPYFKVMNNAATYWYHPHLHMMTEEQVTMGLGGLIIVRDSTEAALNLPRTYGVDDIPLVLSDRRFDSLPSNLNQLLISHLGDTMMVNGTLYPEYNVPAQVVRFRILNAAVERAYRFGFSDSTAFSVIATDGGLLDAPVNITAKRLTLAPGERVEILVDLSGGQGQSVDLIAYNSTLPSDVSGATFGTGTFANALGNRDFLILHLNIIAPTVNPVNTFPATLTTNTFWQSGNASVTRHIQFSDAPDSLCPPAMPGCGWFDSTFFNMNIVNYRIYKDSIEIWELENLSDFAHPFHLHDVLFYILDKNGTLPPLYERGWKDVVLVRKNATVRFITKFENYADSIKPYMYHCHILFHGDAGMMGQFVVVDTALGIGIDGLAMATGFNLYPNPAKEEVTVSSRQGASGKKNKITVFDIMGKEYYSSADITSDFKLQTLSYPNGFYFVQLTGESILATQKLIIQH